MEDSGIKHLFCKATDERALLSYSFKRIDNFYTIISKMDEKDFLYSEHSTLFVLLKSLLNKGVEKFDLAMIVEVARNEGCLQSIGGIDYLQSVNNMQVSDENFHVYLKNVLEASTKYRLHGILKESLATVVDNAKDGKDSSDLMGGVENKILNLSTESKAVSEPIDFADGLVEYIEERKENRIEQIGLSTGHVILNKQIDGLIPATLFVLGARLKEGKSAFLTNIALHVAFIEEKTVLYIDTEMPYQQWRPRVIAAMSGIKERQIIHGGYSDDVHRQIVKRCIERVDNSKLFHEYMPGYSVDKIIALYKKYKARHNLGLIMFDYLKEPDSHSVDRQRKEYQLLGDVTTALKDLAGELQIPAVTAVQLNRAKEIADSDRIARYADVIGLWSTRDKEEIEKHGLDSGSHKLIIQNSRRGGQTPALGIGYHFFKEQLRIKEVDIDKQAVDYSRIINEGSAYYDDTPI